jgi:hypothetical protein
MAGRHSKGLSHEWYARPSAQQNIPLGRRLGWGKLLVIPYALLVYAVVFDDDKERIARREKIQEWCEGKVDNYIKNASVVESDDAKRAN